MKPFRIYRSLNKKDQCNTYLEYFDTLKEALKVFKRECRWRCTGIQIEYLDEDKWRVHKG